MNLLDIKPHSITNGTLGKNFLIYGPPSTRKTTVASHFPNALLLATEVGYSFIPGVKAQNINSWIEFKKALDQLKKPEVREAYDTIVIDTVSLLADQAERYVCNILGVEGLADAPWGKGYTLFNRELSDSFNTLARLGYGIVFIAHSKEVRNEDDELESARPSVSAAPGRIINALVDFTIFLSKGYNEKEEMTVYALTGMDGRYETKTRLTGLAPMFEFNYENLNNEIISAIEGVQGSIGEGEQGLNISDKIEIETEVKPTLEELKATVTELSKKAIEAGVFDEVEERFSTAFSGTPIGELTQAHYNKLEAVEFAIREIIAA